MTSTLQSHTLMTGRLDIRIDRAPEGKCLFEIAERINPKRRFLFVSTILGRHIPVRPEPLRSATRRLAARLSGDLDGSVLVAGFAETAIALGAMVAEEIHAAGSGPETFYLPTTRHPVAGRILIGFEEEHCHAAQHYVLEPDFDLDQENLVIVDDEATTGRTAAELAGALLDRGLRPRRIFFVSLTDWSAGRAGAAIEATCPGIPVSSVSLLEGSWSWTDTGSPTLPPDTFAPAAPVWDAPDDPSNGCLAPRRGVHFARGDFRMPSFDFLRGAGLPEIHPGARVLVVGTGEHCWAPVRLSEDLAALGVDAWSIATTRSPVMTGSVIRRKIAFPDHYGIGVAMYLHNVIPEDWDRIVLLSETGKAGIHPSLSGYLARARGGAHLVDGSGRIHTLRAEALA